MILRRLSTALRKQDWFTVLIETLIVVFGVFLGLQLGNWNNARQENARAEQIIEQLIVDFSEIERRAAQNSISSSERVESIERLMVFLTSDKAVPENVEQFESDLGAPMNVDAPIPRSTTVTELLSAGDTGLIRDSELRMDIIKFDQRVQMAQSAADKINDVWANYGLGFRRYAMFLPELGEDGAATGEMHRVYDIEEMRAGESVLHQLSVMHNMNSAEVMYREMLRDGAADLKLRLEEERAR